MSMIDFKSEIEKYKPLLEIDNIEENIRNDEIQDIMDLLKELSVKQKNQ